jgi:hypothetical protein
MSKNRNSDFLRIHQSFGIHDIICSSSKGLFTWISFTHVHSPTLYSRKAGTRRIDGSEKSNVSDVTINVIVFQNNIPVKLEVAYFLSQDPFCV